MIAVAVLASCIAAGVIFAQQRGGWGGGYGGGYGRGYQRDISDRNGVPEWDVDPAFKHDLFTFVRIRYSSSGYGRRRGGDWMTDFPDSDLNFSFRLQQMTSLKVDPHPKIVELTDDALFDYPFIYMLECGSLQFDDAEVTALRRYLLNGGFLMVDDFWGGDEYRNFYEQIKRVFPEREPVELPIEHPIFHCVFDLKAKPQIPAINVAIRN